MTWPAGRVYGRDEAAELIQEAMNAAAGVDTLRIEHIEREARKPGGITIEVGRDRQMKHDTARDALDASIEAAG